MEVAMPEFHKAKLRVKYLQIIAAAAALVFCTAVNSKSRVDSVVVKASRYLDVASGRYVSPAVILIEDNRIVAVNPAGILPKGLEVIDLGSRTILPGLIDAHTHLTLEIAPGWDTEAVRWTQGDFVLRGVKNARKTLEAGFTTVRNLGALDHADLALARAIDKGWVDGPHMIASGPALSITGGHCDITGFAPGIREGSTKTGVADGADEFLKATRYQIKHGAKVIKVCATAGVLSFEESVGVQQMTKEELEAVVAEAHRHGLKVAAHAHGTAGIIAAAKAGVDSIEHDSVMTEEAARVIKESGAYVVPTLYLTRSIDYDSLPPALQEKGRAVTPLADESFKLALKKGLKIAFGTDAGVFPHGDNAKEFAVRVELGQSPLGAIRSATIDAADLLGVTDRGQIKPGMLADIIAVDGDPVEDIALLEEVLFVMKDGDVFLNRVE